MRYCDFVQVRVEIILHDDLSRFRYSTGCVFCLSCLSLFDFSPMKSDKLLTNEGSRFLGNSLEALVGSICLAKSSRIIVDEAAIH